MDFCVKERHRYISNFGDVESQCLGPFYGKIYKDVLNFSQSKLG